MMVHLISSIVVERNDKGWKHDTTNRTCNKEVW
jgi:hypothetical protein